MDPSYFIVCLAARLFLVIKAHQNPSYAFSSLLFLVGVSFLILALGIVKRDQGVEAGGKIWWKSNRVVHGTLFLLAAKAMKDDLDNNKTSSQISSACLALSWIFGALSRLQFRGKLF